MHRSHPKQSGFSLLEQAMTLPILLLIIAGAVDINTLLQAHSALKEGVSASLRCVYTADGKCVQASPDLRPRLFNYYRVVRHPEYLIDTYDFQGVARWINKPNYLFSNFQAQVLSSVQYEAQTADVSIARRYYPATRLGQFTLRSASMPYITGTARNPVAHYRGRRSGLPEAHGGDFPFTSYSLGALDLRTAGPDVSGVFEFRVANPGGATFEAFEFEAESSARADFGRPAQGTDVNLVLHITGNKENTELGALGGIEIELLRYLPSQKRWSLQEHLGAQQLGRAAGESAQANFVIRGLLPEFIDRSVPEYQELHSYSPLALRYGDRYRIRFTLRSQNGMVGWQGGQLKIFGPVDEPRQETFVCEGGLPPCGDAAACLTEAPDSIFQTPPTIHTALPILRYDSSVRLDSCSRGIVSLQTSLLAHGILECAENFEVLEEQNNCPLQTASIACPSVGTAGSGAPNFGVGELPGPDGILRDSQQALEICPPPEEGIIGPPQSPRWSVTFAAVPSAHIGPNSDGSVLLSKESCGAPISWPEGSLLTNYPHLSYAQVPQGFTPHQSAGVDPETLKNDPLSGFSCPEFPLVDAIVDITSAELTPENSASLFYGSHIKPGCSWQEALKDDATRFNLMPEGAFFEARQPSPSPEKFRSAVEPAACIDPNPEMTWSEPEQRTLVPGGPFEESILPPACTEPGVSCEAEFAGFAAGSPGTTIYDYEHAAQHFGFNEIQAHYPRARWNCNEKDCVSIEVLRDGEFMRAQGGIRVPLYVLGRGTVELRYSGSERREAEFSR